MTNVDQVFAAYKTADGGPEMREVLRELDGIRESDSNCLDKLVRAMDMVSIVVRHRLERLEPLLELAYRKLEDGDYGKVGACILGRIHRSYNVELDVARIQRAGVANVTNGGDRTLRAIEGELGIVVPLEEVAAKAYENLTSEGFVGRGLDALNYAQEHGFEVDASKIDRGEAEKCVAESIKYGIKGRREDLVAAKKRLLFLRYCGIVLASDETIAGLPDSV